MSDHEPYVADPVERPAAPRLVRMGPLLIVLIALLLAAGITALIGPAPEDPALQPQDPAAGLTPEEG